MTQFLDSFNPMMSSKCLIMSSPFDNDLQLMSRFISIVRRHRPKGIDLMDISKEFYNTFGKHLNPIEYKCKNIYQLCQMLAKQCNHSVVVFERNHNNLKSDRILFDEKAYNVWIRRYRFEQNIWFLETLANDVMPRDVQRQHLSQLPDFELPETAFNKNRIHSLVAKLIFIESPDLMFIHLKSDKQKVQQLRRELLFYNGNDELMTNYVLPIELSVVGYICAVKNPLDWDNWNRAIITKVNGNDITLFAFDFGNTIVEERQELRLMKKCLFHWPPLAIKVSLTGIAPKDYDWTEEPIDIKWSEEGTEFLKSFVRRHRSEYNLGAIFIDRLDANYFAVVLHYYIHVLKEDVTEKQPIYLHEKLIRNGFAQMIPVCWTGIVKSRQKPTISESIREPLLAIKCEADFDGYESIPTVLNENECKPKVKSEPIDWSTEQIKVVTTDNVVEVNQNVRNGSELIQKEEINYKRLYFTSNESIELKFKSYFTEIYSFDYKQHKYYTEDQSFICFERKYNTSIEDSIPSNGRKYFKELDSIGSLVRKYIKSDSVTDSRVKPNYLTKESIDYKNKYLR